MSEGRDEIELEEAIKIVMRIGLRFEEQLKLSEAEALRKRYLELQRKETGSS